MYIVQPVTGSDNVLSDDSNMELDIVLDTSTTTINTNLSDELPINIMDENRDSSNSQSTLNGMGVTNDVSISTSYEEEEHKTPPPTSKKQSITTTWPITDTERPLKIARASINGTRKDGVSIGVLHSMEFAVMFKSTTTYFNSKYNQPKKVVHVTGNDTGSNNQYLSENSRTMLLVSGAMGDLYTLCVYGNENKKLDNVVVGKVYVFSNVIERLTPTYTLPTFIPGKGDADQAPECACFKAHYQSSSTFDIQSVGNSSITVKSVQYDTFESVESKEVNDHVNIIGVVIEQYKGLAVGGFGGTKYAIVNQHKQVIRIGSKLEATHKILPIGTVVNLVMGRIGVYQTGVMMNGIRTVEIQPDSLVSMEAPDHPWTQQVRESILSKQLHLYNCTFVAPININTISSMSENLGETCMIRNKVTTLDMVQGHVLVGFAGFDISKSGDNMIVRLKCQTPGCYNFVQNPQPGDRTYKCFFSPSKMRQLEKNAGLVPDKLKPHINKDVDLVYWFQGSVVDFGACQPDEYIKIANNTSKTNDMKRKYSYVTFNNDAGEHLLEHKAVDFNDITDEQRTALINQIDVVQPKLYWASIQRAENISFLSITLSHVRF